MDDELRDVNPSCMWGLMKVVDYQHWRGLKKTLPYKRNHGRGAKGYQILNDDSAEEQMLLHEEGKRFSVDQNTKRGGSTKKRSIKSRFKSLLTHHSSKEGNGEHQPTKYSPRSGLQRTYSIHHLQSPDYDPAEICSNWDHPIIIIPGKKEVEAPKLQELRKKNITEKPDISDEGFTKLKRKDGSKDNLEEFANVLELFKVDKKLFFEILHNANKEIRKSSSMPPTRAKPKLVKSGSFPAAYMSHGRSLRPSKLEHKQSESWWTLKWEKFPSHSYDSREFTSRPSFSSENIRGIKLGRALSLILESTRGLDEEHREVVSASHERNQRVQTEGNGISSPSAHDEVPNETKVDTDGGDIFSKNGEMDEYMSRKQDISYRRSASLNESLDKYAALFENNFGKEGTLNSSKSLRLRDEEIGSYKHTPRLFSRVRSLSNIDLFSSFQHGGYGEANFADWSITYAKEIAPHTNGNVEVESNTKSFSDKFQEIIESDSVHGSESQDINIEEGDHTYEVDELPAPHTETFTGEYSSRIADLPGENTEPSVGERNSCLEQRAGRTVNTPNELPQSCPVSDSGSSFEDKEVALEDFHSVEGLEDRLDYFDQESSPLIQGSINDTVNTNSPCEKISKSYKKDDADLDYIRHILEYSGLTKDAFNWKWHSAEQPLRPSLFDEACRPQDLECFTEDLSSFYYYQLLFDLVNDELVHFYERSTTYYPRALSSSCNVRPFPIGDHVIEDICGSISKLLNLRQEEQLSLDSFIDFELRKDENWMNLQWESESVALEVDHMIFDQLLEELIC